MHTGVLVTQLENRTPSEAIRSRLGVFTQSPLQLIASQRIWSVIMNRMFGFFIPLVLATERFSQGFFEVSAPARNLIISYRHRYCLLGANDADKAFAASYGCVEQVALQKLEVLCRDENNHGRILATL